MNAAANPTVARNSWRSHDNRVRGTQRARHRNARRFSGPRKPRPGRLGSQAPLNAHRVIPGPPRPDGAAALAANSAGLSTLRTTIQGHRQDYARCIIGQRPRYGRPFQSSPPMPPPREMIHKKITIPITPPIGPSRLSDAKKIGNPIQARHPFWSVVMPSPVFSGSSRQRLSGKSVTFTHPTPG